MLRVNCPEQWKVWKRGERSAYRQVGTAGEKRQVRRAKMKWKVYTTVVRPHILVEGCWLLNCQAGGWEEDQRGGWGMIHCGDPWKEKPKGKENERGRVFFSYFMPTQWKNSKKSKHLASSCCQVTVKMNWGSPFSALLAWCKKSSYLVRKKKKHSSYQMFL